MKKTFNEYINIPNLLTMLRIVVIVPMVICFINKNYIWAVVFLAISGLSDFLDGKLARKLNQTTKFGAILDPIADKMTLIALVICIGIEIPITVPLVIFLFVKEILMLSGGLYLMKNKLPVPSAEWYGKLSTFVFYISMLIIVICYLFLKYENVYLACGLMIFTAVCMAYSLVRYFLLFINIIKTHKNRKENS